MSQNRKNIRIRSNLPLDKITMRRRNMSLNQRRPNNQIDHIDYLAEVKKIMAQAKQTSKTLNIQFMKISSRPAMEVVYITAEQLQKRLRQLNTKKEQGKYYVLIQVRKDALNGYATKKQIVTDQIIQKNYKTIYKQYFQDQNNQTAVQILDNRLVNLYQFYDDEDNAWKQSLKSKQLIARQVNKQTKQKEKLQGKEKQKQDEEKQDLHLSQRSNQANQKYSKMFEQIAVQNRLFQPIKPNLPVHYIISLQKAQKIVIERFQNKFYKSRERKFQYAFDRLTKAQTIELSQTINQQMSNLTPKKKKKINLLIPESCQRVFRTQNKLLQEHISKGLSKDHKKRLIVEFNKTILDMKINRSTENAINLSAHKSHSQHKKRSKI